MTRTSDCIQMLMLLKSRGFMTRQDLARELKTNTRNILEYKKELEGAGYCIRSTLGKFGGYSLERGTLLPVNRFDPEEERSLKEASAYLKSHHDFLLQSAYQSAMDKIQANVSISRSESDIYMEQEPVVITKRMRKAIKQCEQAKAMQRCIELQYRSMKANIVESVRVQPYEILNYKGVYYCLGYSLKAKDYRIFRFSEERMKDLIVLHQPFQRDQDFRLKDHIGKSGLVKGEVIELEVYIYRETARMIAERHIGMEPHMEWINGEKLHLTTIMEGKINCISFLLSLKNDVTLLSPQSLKEEMLEIIEDMKCSYVQS